LFFRMGKGLKGGHALSHDRFSISDMEQRSVLSCVDSCDDTLATVSPKGLLNIGNSCYANAVIQCLLNTALTDALNDPSASAIFRRYSSNPNILAQGSGSVDSEEDCATHTDASSITALSQTSSVVRRKHAVRERKKVEQQYMLQKSVWLKQALGQISREYHSPEPRRAPQWLYKPEIAVVDPGAITRCPNELSKSLTPYQQEDAHEFLRALLGTLVMHGQNKELSSLFDGLLESSVTCQTCFRPSLTRDRYMDLSLDIAAVNTLTEALQEFTCTETLLDDNCVFCRHCNKKRPATKELRLATAPSILVTHLKRFAYDKTGRLMRLKKHIGFPTTLEIGDFMSKVNQARPPPYDLVAVLVHQGVSCDSGHYLAYVKNGGSWYKCNDAFIERVDLDTVLRQQAYILMYEVANMRENHGFNRPKTKSKTKPPEDFFSIASSMLCGIDYDTAILSDFCNYLGRKSPPSRRRKRGRRKHDQSRDDLSTLGESTVESSRDRTSNRFRRSSSSGNLRREQHVHGRSSSVSASARRSSDNGGVDSYRTSYPGMESYRVGHNRMGRHSANDRPKSRPRSNSGRELPPRPDHHRRVLSDAPPAPVPS
jgi:Ubiquitin carboxyl-terminal hydrolase